MQITVDWFVELLTSSGVGHILVVIALTIALGMALGKIKIGGVSLGATWVLLIGIVISHFGMSFPEHLFHDENNVPHFINPHVLGFVRDFGLILFVYSVGLRSGKGFFEAFKKGGLKLNLLAIGLIACNVAAAVAIFYITGLDMPTVVGILSGAVTNTPGLGAAQSVCASLKLDENVLASAYAAAYPCAVLGVIFTIVVLRFLFKVTPSAAEHTVEAGAPNDAKTAVQAQPVPTRVPILQIFAGVFLGVLLGSIPIGLPGIPQPLRLGLAGGPLVVALILGAYGEKLHFPTPISPNMLSFMAEIGQCLFMACVGLKAGETFFSTLAHGGLSWVWYGVIITVVPLLTIGVVAFKACKVDYFTLAGMLSGSMTNPPGLAYSMSTYNDERVSVGYATVYPLTMFLRIMSAQLLILFLA